MKVIFLSASEEHAYRVGFYMISFIRAYIWRWHTSNARMKPYHVLGSMYRIGDGSEMSLLLIPMI